MTTPNFLASAQRTLDIERDAVAALGSRLGEDFIAACSLILACTGRVVVTGMGKSGHIGGKIAATLASTGTPAFFVHPGEASHGDLGMLTRSDVVIAISNSGETAEVLTILPLIKRDVARNVLYERVTSTPRHWYVMVLQPWQCPARLARLILFLP